MKRDLVFSYCCQAWVALVSLVFVPLYVRYLGIEAYGLIGLFAVINAWLSLLDIGMSPTLEREMARFTSGKHSGQSIRTLLHTIEVIAFSLAVLITLFVSSGAGWIANDWLQQSNLPKNTVRHAISIIGFVIGLRFFEGIYRSAIIGLQQQAWVSICNAILQSFRHGGAIVILVFMSPTIYAFFLWQGVVSVITIVIYTVKVHSLLPNEGVKARFSIEAIRDVWRYAGGVVGITALALILTQTDKILLSRLLSLKNYGYYTIASMLAALLFTAIGPIVQTLYPRLVQFHAAANQESFVKIFHQGAQLVTIVTAPFLTLAILFPQEVLFVWLGDHDVAIKTAPIMTPMVLGSFLNGLMWMPSKAQLAFGWTRLTLKMNLASVIVLIPAIFWIVPIYGAVGAAWIWVILNCGYVIIGAQLMFRKIMIREAANWYLEDLVRPVISAVFTGFILLIFLTFFGGDGRIAQAFQLAIVAFMTFVVAAGTANQLKDMRRTLLKIVSKVFEK